MERGLKRLERWRRLVASKPSTSVLTAREEDFLDHSDGEGQDFSVACLFYLPGSCFPVVVELGGVAPWILGKSLTDDLYSGDAANLATRYSGCVMTSTHERRREAPVSPNLSTSSEFSGREETSFAGDNPGPNSPSCSMAQELFGLKR